MSVRVLLGSLPHMLLEPDKVKASTDSEVPQSFLLLSTIILPAVLADGHQHHHEPISLLGDTKISFLTDRRPSERVVGSSRVERRRQLRKKGLQQQQKPRSSRLENTLTPPLQVKFSPELILSRW